jgi:hypothetical protein
MHVCIGTLQSPSINSADRFATRKLKPDELLVIECHAFVHALDREVTSESIASSTNAF